VAVRAGWALGASPQRDPALHDAAIELMAERIAPIESGGHPFRLAELAA
jgi:hypothetical protein